jgi:hypothetical protein
MSLGTLWTKVVYVCVCTEREGEWYTCDYTEIYPNIYHIEDKKDWIDLAQDRGRRGAIVNTAINFGVPKNAGKFLSSCTSGGFWRQLQATCPWTARTARNKWNEADVMISVFWAVMPCSLVDVGRHFGETYCFLLQVRSTGQASNKTREVTMWVLCNVAVRPVT